MQRVRSRLPLWNVGDLVALGAGLIGFLEFTLVGQMFATNLSLLLVFFSLATKRIDLLWKGLARPFLFLLFIWLVGQVATDLIRGSEPADLMRGWAKILFTATNFGALYLLFVERRSRAVLYASGLAGGELLKYLIRPNPAVVDDFWKWGVGTPITFILVIAAAISLDRRRNTLTLGLLTAATLANLYFNYRSVALLCFVTLSWAFLLPKRDRFKANGRQTVYLTVALLVCGFLFQQGYSYAAHTGVLGSSAQEKYREQAAGDMGMLLGGRAESFASLQAVADSPIIGHGSWARDARYVDLLKEMYQLHGYGKYNLEDDLIPSHSHLIGAWVESGLAGAVFWLWVLWVAIRGTLKALTVRSRFGALIIFCGLSLIWDILFSPYTGERTFVTPLYVILMMFSLRPRGFRRPHKSWETIRTRPVLSLQPSDQLF